MNDVMEPEESEFDEPSAPAIDIGSEEAERAVLGALINDSAAFDQAGILDPKDFSDVTHRILFGSLQELERQGKDIDLITLSDTLRRHKDYQDHPNLLESARQIADENFTSERIEYYADIIRDYATQRHLRLACHNIVTWLNDPRGRNAEDILNEAEKTILEVSDRDHHGRDDFQRIGTASTKAVEEVQKRYDWVRANPGKPLVLGTPTGFTDFDNPTSGLQKGELVILAGSPGMGKTSLAMNIAFNVAVGGIPGNEEAVAAIFSMEMSAEQLANRMLANMAGVNQKQLQNGRLDDSNWQAIESAMGMLQKPNLYVHEISSATPSFIRRKSRRLKAQHDGRLDLIVIDYLQLMPSEGRDRNSNRNNELADITRELKAIANELQTPVLCLSQLNRQGSGRDAGDAPKLQELRDSGAIEQDADIVMFLYKSSDDNSEQDGDICNAELKIAKNRNGPTFTVPLVFTKNLTRFLPRSHDEYRGETPNFEDDT